MHVKKKPPNGIFNTFFWLPTPKYAVDSVQIKWTTVFVLEFGNVLSHNFLGERLYDQNESPTNCSQAYSKMLQHYVQ